MSVSEDIQSNLDDEKEIDEFIENIYDAANITDQDNLIDSMIEESKGDL